LIQATRLVLFILNLQPPELLALVFKPRIEANCAASSGEGNISVGLSRRRLPHRRANPSRHSLRARLDVHSRQARGLKAWMAHRVSRRRFLRKMQAPFRRRSR
jgi:hypothetical protein